MGGHGSSGIGRHWCHRRVGHAGRRRQGQGAEGGRRARHRLRRRRARLPDPATTSSRPPSPPAATRRTTSTRRPPACPSCARRSPPRRRATPATRSTPRQVLVTNGGKHAVYNAFAALLRPGRRGAAARAVLDHLPRGDHARRRRAGRRSSPTRPTGFRVTRRAARGGAHRPRTKVLLFVSPVQPDRRGLPAGRGRGDRPVGRSSTASGWSPTRSTSTSSTATPSFASMPALRARAGRHVRRRQRRRQDLRDDRLAGRLDDRPGRRHQGRDQPAVARHVERLQRRAGGRARRGRAATCRRWPRCARRSTGGGARSSRCSTTSPASPASSRRARSTPSRR